MNKTNNPLDYKYKEILMAKEDIERLDRAIIEKTDDDFEQEELKKEYNISKIESILRLVNSKRFGKDIFSVAEKMVLDYLLDDLTVTEIGIVMEKNESTIRYYRDSLYKKIKENIEYS